MSATSSRRRRSGSGLGRTQILVLRLLAEGARSPQQMEYDWPGLTESAAYGAVMRLADRGLVDAAGWDQYGRRRIYGLTDRGYEVERALNEDPVE